MLVKTLWSLGGVVLAVLAVSLLLALGCGTPAARSPIPMERQASATTIPQTPQTPVPTPTAYQIPAIGTGGGEKTPATVVVPPTNVTPAPPKHLVSPTEITLADNRTTVQLSSGQRFLLSLDGGYDWTVKVADETVVRRIGDQAQGIYEASRPGQTTLVASGDPRCRPLCGMPSIEFRLWIVVQPVGLTVTPSPPESTRGLAPVTLR